MKNITYLFLSLLFLSSTPKNSVKPIDEILIGSWRIDSIELNYIKKPSDYIKPYDYKEYNVISYSNKGKINYSTLKLNDNSSKLKEDNSKSGIWTMYKKNVLIEYIDNKNSGNAIWTSEITVIDDNTIKKVLNYEDNVVSIDDKNIIGESVILKRIE
jgi:hypothetical protein